LAAASSASASSGCELAAIQYPALARGPIDWAACPVSLAVKLCLRHQQQIDAYANWSDHCAQSQILCRMVNNVVLNHQQIEVRVFGRVATTIGSKHDHLHGRPRGGRDPLGDVMNVVIGQHKKQ